MNPRSQPQRFNSERKSRRSYGPSGFLTQLIQLDWRAIRSGGCAHVSSSYPRFCQICVTQQRAVTGLPFTSCGERFVYSIPVSLIVMVSCPSSPSSTESESAFLVSWLAHLSLIGYCFCIVWLRSIVRCRCSDVSEACTKKPGR